MTGAQSFWMAALHLVILSSQVYLTYLGLKSAQRAKKIEVSVNGMLLKLLAAKHAEGYLQAQVDAGKQ